MGQLDFDGDEAPDAPASLAEFEAEHGKQLALEVDVPVTVRLRRLGVTATQEVLATTTTGER